MKRSLESLVILAAIFAICSCASKPEVQSTDVPPPPVDASAAEAAAYKAETAAKRAEDSAKQARAAGLECRQDLEKVQGLIKKSEESANQAQAAAIEARRLLERMEAGAKQCQDSSRDARQSAERAERAAQRAEASAAGRPAPAIKAEPAPTKPAEVEWTYEKNAIRLLLKGDPELNLYQKTSHTLVFCIYNLKDPNVFNQLREERGGLVKLLEGGRFDPSVTYSKRLVIEPGQELTEVWDRSEGARFVGVAAGYYHFQKEKMVKLFPIPVVSEKKGKTVFYKPAPLNIGVYLGAQEIQDLR